MPVLDGTKYKGLLEIPGCRRWGASVDAPVDVVEMYTGTSDLALSDLALDDGSFDDAMRGKMDFWDRLRPAQQEDVRLFLQRAGLIVAHPCSGGKTLTGIAAGHASGFPVLVCAPALARGVWRQELAKWAPSARMAVLSGRTPDKDFTRAGADFYFINYEVLADWGPALAALEWQTVILDEAHEIRGRRAARVTQGYRRAVALSRPRVIGLTATPIWNRIAGMWTLLDLIHPGWYGTYAKFIERYMGAELSFEWGGMVLGDASHTDELRERLAYVVRRVEAKHLLPGLPEMVRFPVLVDNPQAAARLTAFAQSILANGDMNTDWARGLISRALTRETRHKVPALLDYLATREDRKVLVATQLRASATLVADKLAAKLGAGTVFTFDGDDSLEQRMAVLARAAAAPAPVVVVCTMASARQSIDAACMDAVAVLELPWTVEELVQFEGRVQRTTRSEASKLRSADVEAAYFVVDGSMDKKLLDMLAVKLEERVAALGGETRDVDFSRLLRDALCDNERARTSLLAQFDL